MFAFLLLQISVSAQSSIKGKVTDAAMVPAAYGITVTPPATYYTQPAVAYVGTSTEKLGKIALQKWVSLFFTGLEAWFDWRRTGLPVIVGDSGGAIDAVVDNETGYLVDGNNTSEIAQRIAFLISNPDVAKRMGGAGRNWVTQEWTWDQNFKKIDGLLSGQDFAD